MPSNETGTWVYNTAQMKYHLYFPRTSDEGRLDDSPFRSVCGQATTKTMETKTPGGRWCEQCKAKEQR